jgi:integrase/recombinase XerD
MKISQAVQQYREFLKLEIRPATTDRYLGDVNLFTLYMKDVDIHTVKDSDVIGYLNLMKQLGWQHNSVVTKSKSIRSFWKWLNKKHYPTFNAELIPNMRKEFKFSYVTSEADMKKVLAVMAKRKKHHYYPYTRNLAIIKLLWDTGARNGEIASLNVADLDVSKMKAVIRTEKSRGRRPAREIYWTKDTNDTLKAWLKERNAQERKQPFVNPEALFTIYSNQRRGLRLTNSGISLMLGECARLAKIPRFNAHGMRHHMGHELSRRGANNSQISSILGHSQLSSSYIYTELNNTEREEAYTKFFRRSR